MWLAIARSTRSCATSKCLSFANHSTSQRSSRSSTTSSLTSSLVRRFVCHYLVFVKIVHEQRRVVALDPAVLGVEAALIGFALPAVEERQALVATSHSASFRLLQQRAADTLAAHSRQDEQLRDVALAAKDEVGQPVNEEIAHYHTVGRLRNEQCVVTIESTLVGDDTSNTCL